MGFKEMKMMKSTEPSVDEVGKGMKKGGKPKMQMGGVPPLAAAAAPAKIQRGEWSRTGAPATGPMPARSMPVSEPPVRGTPVSQRPPATPRFSTSTPVRRPSGPKAVLKPAIRGGGPGPNPFTVDSRPIGFGGPNTDRRSTEINPDKLREVEALSPMKKGGGVETKKMHAKEASEIRGIKKELMTHESKAASKAHKGLKSGGVPKYATGGLIQKFATGGVVGYKDGGHCGMKSGGEAGFKTNKKNCSW